MRVQEFCKDLSSGRSWWPQSGTDTTMDHGDRTSSQLYPRISFVKSPSCKIGARWNWTIYSSTLFSHSWKTRFGFYASLTSLHGKQRFLFASSPGAFCVSPVSARAQLRWSGASGRRWRPGIRCSWRPESLCLPGEAGRGPVVDLWYLGGWGSVNESRPKRWVNDDYSKGFEFL